MPTPSEEEEGLEDAIEDDEIHNEIETAGQEEYDAEFGATFNADPPDGSSDEIEEAWAPLTIVIQKFKYITDLIWVCRNQLPPGLFRALNQYHPSCRLEMRSFRLRSLRDPVTDSHELELVQSPSLYSISVKTVGKDSDAKCNYNGYAIYQVVALAPNLRHLNIVKPRVASSAALFRLRTTREPYVPWKGFVPPLHVTGRGVLYSLAYSGLRHTSLEDIQEWPKYTDLSKLQFLNLGKVSDPLVIPLLVRNLKLISLKSFHADLEPKADNYGLLTLELEVLLQNLDPLEEIALKGYLTTSIIDKIIKHHSQTLRRLAINPYHYDGPQPPLLAIGPDEILKIECACSKLENLKISIPHSSAADTDELSVLCPNINRLQELTLLLLHEVGSKDSFTKTAQKIWHIIENGKAGYQLRRLTVEDSYTTVIMDKASMENQSKVEVVAIDFLHRGNQQTIEEFHDLPTARFRFPR